MTRALQSSIIPDKITKSKDQYGNTGELYNIRKIGIESLNIVAEHGCLCRGQ